MKKILGVSIIVIIFLATVAAFFILGENNEPGEEINFKDSPINQDNQEQCGFASQPLFNYEFTDFSKIEDFQPIGSISGASRGRSYITVKKGETVPVYAPTDATLISVIYAFRGPEADHGEYGFKFNAKCGVTFLLDHLDSASEEMKKYAPAEPSRSTATDDSLSIPIKAGTLLGYTNGTPQARTFDFLAIDRNIKTFYINPKRWEWEQSLYSVCPYDLYEKNLKEKYYQKIGISSDTGFKKAENCGQPSYDIPGTISGGWFSSDMATDLKGDFMLIGERMGAVDLTIKSDSESLKLRITDYNPKIMPREIGIGESICYQGFNNDWVFLHLIDGQTIEVSNGSGACPASFPETKAEKWQR
jgi:hypothetical protein